MFGSLFRKCYGAALLTVLAVVPGAAQEEHHHHSSDEKIGKVHFSTSCSKQAQAEFNRAVAWLHSFEYGESERAFREIANSDSQCAMAHWGVAMSLYHQLWAPPTAAELVKGAAAVKEAKQIGAKTKREQDYINAIATFFEESQQLDHRTRAARYERAMQQVYQRYPRDRDAAVFYALALNASALAAAPMDKTYAKQKKAAILLNRVLRLEPEHPGVTHYLIHSYDYPELASYALAAARSYSRIAPSSAHALHMPSHIFTRLGLWDEDVESNIRSEKAAKEYARQNHLDGVWDEQLHAMDYLAYAYLQQARDSEAQKVLDELRAIRKTEPETFKCAYSFAAIPARITLERRNWAEAAELKVEPVDFPWKSFPWAQALIHFARAIGAARSNNPTQARNEVDKLAAIHKQLAGSKDGYDWATQVEIQRQVADAWLTNAEGKSVEALEKLRAAADLEDSTDKHPVTPGAVLPARELLGDLYIELNQAAKALTEYERSLADSPNRLNSLFGAGRAAELAGNRLKSGQYYTKLIKICERGDNRRKELAHARQFLSKSRQATSASSQRLR
jgi:tetratricopeptide (TPR) repeat protein